VRDSRRSEPQIGLDRKALKLFPFRLSYTFQPIVITQPQYLFHTRRALSLLSSSIDHAAEAFIGRYENPGQPLLLYLEDPFDRSFGYFHSHPQRGNAKGISQISKDDEDSIEHGEIELVIAINDKKRLTSWRESNKRLIGTLGKYRFDISGFY